VVPKVQSLLALVHLRDGAAAVKLSRREAEVMDLLARGKSHKEVAAELGVHLDTARGQLHRVRVKLGARTTFQAMALYGALSRQSEPTKDAVD
jgi:DNA-binding CsgD family transcriptional regulator